MKFLTLEREAEVVAHIQSQLPQVMAIYVYGSEARNEVRDDSDVDIAVLGEHYFEPLKLWNCRQNLAVKLGRDVDLIDLRAVSTVLRMQVFTDGHLILDNSNGQSGSYESLTYSDYARLNEERAGILEDIKNRGSVYG